MGYCLVSDMQRLLPEKVTIGNQNIGTPSPGRSGNQGSQRSNISTTDAQHFIDYASSYLDGRLRSFYSCPLRRIKSFETEVLNNITHGSSINVTVHDSGPFLIGQLVRLQDKNGMETCSVISTSLDDSNLTVVTLQHVTNNYLTADDTRISVLEYPDPIPLVTAQMAVSFALDKLYTASQAPDVSNYGKTQRNLARSQIENILSGEVLLFGQEHTGKRFVRMSVFDTFRSPVTEVQKGVDKE